MTALIPFVTGTTSARLFEDDYQDSDFVRISLLSSREGIRRLEKLKTPLWVDGAVDGLHYVQSGKIVLSSDQGLGPWKKLMRSCDGRDVLVALQSLKKPPKQKLEEFVNKILDKSQELEPSWLSVPQLPIVNGSERNRFNIELAKAAAKWKIARKFKGIFVLPVIFTHQEQLKRKTEWKKTLVQARRTFDASDSKVIWIVDSSVGAYTASRTLDRRFGSLIDIQEYVTSEFPKNTIRVCGPYWGMNLLLWTRGLCDYAATGLGASFQYMIPGFPPFPTSTGRSRIALSPLRRTAVVSSELHAWIKKTLRQIDAGSQPHNALQFLATNWQGMADEFVARQHVAKFYRHWYDLLAKSDKKGRAVALY
jgi:hypothetical protein